MATSSDKTYDITDQEILRQGSRPALSRNSTETETDVGDRSRSLSLSPMSSLETASPKDPQLQRARTTLRSGEGTSQVPTRLPVRLGRVRTLQDQITRKMEKELGLSASTMKKHMPEEVLAKLMKEDAVRSAMQNPTESPSDGLVAFSKRNSKVFAITVLCHEQNFARVQAMNAFQYHDFTDACLPVEKMSLKTVCSFNAYDSDGPGPEAEVASCNHRPAAYAFHEEPWTETNIGSFYGNQWGFLVPKISIHVFEYNFESHEILPFEKYANGFVKKGHFGEVSHVKMLAKYQNLFDSTNVDTIDVAIKKMTRHAGPEYDNYGNWRRETKALQVFNKLSTLHIIRGIGAFAQNDDLFTVMEWADRGDLITVMKTHYPTAHLDLNSDHMMQLLEQFRGIAMALNQMHNFKVEPDGNLPGLILSPELENDGKLVPAINVPEIRLPEPTETEIASAEPNPQDHQPTSLSAPSQTSSNSSSFLKPEGGVPKINEPRGTKPTENWRHGDIKPENILSFKDGSSMLGRLKLADLGTAQQHSVSTGFRIGTKTPWSSLPYVPPEIWTTKTKSRFLDIWSIGCVLLETIIWLLFGFEELKIFKDRTCHFGTLYWSDANFANTTAKLNELTFEWLDRLLTIDPECRDSRGGSAMRDLLLLIKNKLLVIKVPAHYDIPESGCRINSSSLVEELEKIIAKGKQDKFYLYSGTKRRGISMPPLTAGQRRDSLSVDVNLSGGNVYQSHKVTPAPPLARPPSDSGEGKRLIDSYRHAFDDKWHYVDDYAFASSVIKLPRISQLLPEKPRSHLCGRCEAINWDSPSFEVKFLLTELRGRILKQGCRFCSLLVRVAERFHGKDWVEFDRVESGLRMDRSTGLPALVIRRTAEQKVLPGELSSRTQFGLPKIPKGGSPAHFDILRAWLNDCDGHKTCQTMRPKSIPTRIIDVGNIKLPRLRLIESASLTPDERASLQYIALSYPWGKSPPHTHYVTNQSNIKAHLTDIPSILPKTLADAVETARQLDICYLWIDSLCIIQGENGDFAAEADKMEDVFSSAYCVLAATAANGSSSGFLHRTSTLEINSTVDPSEAHQSTVYFSEKNVTGHRAGIFHVHEPFDDFDKDVLQGPLNQRGWVFQERALARRTIHFANTQTYWECGDGIRCETLTKLQNNRVGFLGDANFPNYGLQRSSKGGEIAFYENLYEQYSKLSFSNPEDRPFAISGLEQRLSKAMKQKRLSEATYGEERLAGALSGRAFWGIFDDYWGRCLLWQRNGDTNLVRLVTGAGQGKSAPSWSWQGHSGGITFMKPDGGSVQWLINEVKLPWRNVHGFSAMTTASYHGDRSLTGMARDLPKDSDAELASGRYQMLFDNEADRLTRGPLKCLIIGRMNTPGLLRDQVRNYVLVLARKVSSPDNVYERIGAGYLHGSLIDFDQITTVLVE